MESRDELTVFHRRKGLPDAWDRIVAAHLAAWDSFSPAEQEQLRDTADWLLKHKHWEAAQGFALDDEILTVVALSAAVLVLGLDESFYREVSAIIVYPTTIMSRGTYAGPVQGTLIDDNMPVLGQAHDHRGPIIVAWDDALQAARNPGHGHNVVFHEFAHKIDMLDDTLDGTPPLSKEDVARWVEVCTDAFESLRAGDHRPPLDPYGGVNPAEFFAVATETFFDASAALRLHEPEVYGVLRDFYSQDPATRTQ